MPCKKKEPPRVEFTPFTVKRSRLENPPQPIKKEWIDEIRKKEIEFSYHASEDVERLKAVFEPKKFNVLCKAFGLDAPRIRRSEKSDEFIKKFADQIMAYGKKEPLLQTVEEEESEKSASDVPSEAEEQLRMTIRDSIPARLKASRVRPAPYKVDLTSESSDHMTVTHDDERSEGGSSQESSKVQSPIDDDLYVNPPSTDAGPPEDILEDLRSPYQKFFCRSKKDIENHLDKDFGKKAHTETEKIFSDFINFLNLPEVDLKCPNITLESLRNLFDIRLENPAAHAYCADSAELPYVPKEISDAYDDIQASSRASLHRQIVWDIMYEKGREKKVAFGRTVPNPRPKWNKNTRNSWLLSEEIPWGLVSGRELWKDLLTSEILEGFGKWLLANPQYDRPKYLEKIKFFEKIPVEDPKEDPVRTSLKKKRCGEAFYTLANNMKYFIGDNELSYLPRLEELKSVLQTVHQVPGEDVPNAP